jgi:UDP-glucose 4-epimerase
LRILVTGSAGHLGEALIRTLRSTSGMEVFGIDVLSSPFTDLTGSVTDRDFVRHCMHGVDAVLHTATLHKPHVATEPMQAFIDTNVTGTLVMLEATLAAGVETFVFTSTTSVFGMALRPPAERPAVWVTEDLQPVPRNIYGVTKAAAEDVCQLFHQQHGLSCVVLRTSRFFPEDDDDDAIRSAYQGANLKANELLFRRADLADVVDAHVSALDRAGRIGFGRLIVSATTPFLAEDVGPLRTDASAVLDRRVPGWREVYAGVGWNMLPGIDRVYVNTRARDVLDWRPRYDFAHTLECLRRGTDPRSPLAIEVGSKGYHRREAPAAGNRR